MEEEKRNTYCFAHVRHRRATLLHDRSLEKKKVASYRGYVAGSSGEKVGARQRSPKGPGPSPVS